MDIALSAATPSERHIVRNLYPFYLHDLAEFAPALATVNRHGVYDGSHSRSHEAATVRLNMWWEQPDLLRPFLIRAAGKPAGFALVSSPPYGEAETDFTMNDFFVLRQFRRRGVARRAAMLLLQLLPGTWQFSVVTANQPALAFWETLLPSIDNRELTVHDGALGQSPNIVKARVFRCRVRPRAVPSSSSIC